MVTRLEGGRTHPSQVVIRNTSGRPAIFRISVAPGTVTALSGFTQENVGTPVTTRQLAAGEEAVIRAFFSLPVGSPAGPKSFQVRVEEVDAAGQSRGLALAPQIFTGLATVEGLIEAAPLPPEVAPPPSPTLSAKHSEFGTVLLQPTLELRPQDIAKPRPGVGVITVLFSREWAFDQSFRFTTDIFLIRPGFPDKRLGGASQTPPRSGTGFTDRFNIEDAPGSRSTAGLAPGPYTFRIDIFEASNLEPGRFGLIRSFNIITPILTIGGLARPVLPVVPTLDVGAPQVSLDAREGGGRPLNQAQVGDTFRVRFPVTATSLPAGTPVGAQVLPLRGVVELLDPTGRSVRRDSNDFSPSIGMQFNVPGGPFTIPSSAPTGQYLVTLRITSLVPEVSFDLRFPPAPTPGFPAFSLAAPTEVAAAAGISAEQLLQGLRLAPPQVSLPSGVNASFVTPGTPITLSLLFAFPTLPVGARLPPDLPPLRALVSLRGPSQRTTIQLLDTMNLQPQLGTPVRLPSVELPRGAEPGAYTISVFIVDPFNPTTPGGQANYLPNFGPGIFPAGFSGAFVEVDAPTAAPTAPEPPRAASVGTVLAQSFTFSNPTVLMLNGTNNMTVHLRNNNGFPALVLLRLSLGRSGTNLLLGTPLHPVETFGFPLTLPPNTTFSFQAPARMPPSALAPGSYNMLVTVSDPVVLDRIISERQFSSVLTIQATTPPPVGGVLI